MGGNPPMFQLFFPFFQFLFALFLGNYTREPRSTQAGGILFRRFELWGSCGSRPGASGLAKIMVWRLPRRVYECRQPAQQPPGQRPSKGHFLMMLNYFGDSKYWDLVHRGQEPLDGQIIGLAASREGYGSQRTAKQPPERRPHKSPERSFSSDSGLFSEIRTTGIQWIGGEGPDRDGTQWIVWRWIVTRELSTRFEARGRSGFHVKTTEKEEEWNLLPLRERGDKHR